MEFFPEAKTKELMLHLIPNLKRSPTTSLFISGRMISHIRTKTSFMKNSKDPNRANVVTHPGETGKALDVYSRKNKNTLLMDDFNVEPDGANMKAFCNQ